MIQPLLVFSDWGLLILRVALGAILLAHSLPKVRNLKNNAANFEMMGFKPGIFWGTIVALLESVGGLAVIAGFFVQVVAIFLIIEFAVIILKLKSGQKLVDGYELDLLVLASAFVLLTIGSGGISLDSFFGFVLY